MHMVTRTKRWTLDELLGLPDDGNKYELVDGELFVTPAPAEMHETILARLTRLLEPYVAANALGLVYHPRAVVRVGGSEVEPDLMVRDSRQIARGNDWNDAPLPRLVVEVLSPYTRRRDLVQKRDWYTRIGIPDYWVIDPEQRTVRVVRPGVDELVLSDVVHWHPAPAAAALTVDVPRLFENS
jgi:Uma2 family endonuclease